MISRSGTNFEFDSSDSKLVPDTEIYIEKALPIYDLQSQLRICVLNPFACLPCLSPFLDFFKTSTQSQIYQLNNLSDSIQIIFFQFLFEHIFWRSESIKQNEMFKFTNLSGYYPKFCLALWKHLNLDNGIKQLESI